MAIKPQEGPNQFMFTALPFEGLINYEMQQKRQRDAMNLQMNAQLGKFEGEMRAAKHHRNDDDDFQALMGEMSQKTDEFLARHPEGLHTPDATRDFYRHMSEVSNDRRFRAMAYNNDRILEANKDLMKNKAKYDGPTLAYEKQKLNDFKTLNDDGSLNYFSMDNVETFDRDKAILGVAKEVPAVKDFIEMSDAEKVRFMKTESLEYQRIMKKAEPYILSNPDIRRVRDARVARGIQTKEQFEQEILSELSGVAHLLSYEDKFKPSGNTKKDIKDPFAGAYQEGLGTISLQVTRDYIQDIAGISNKEFENTDYNFTGLIDTKQQSLDAIRNKGQQLEDARQTKADIDRELKEIKDSYNGGSKDPFSTGLGGDVRYMMLSERSKELEKNIKVLEIPMSATEAAEEEAQVKELTNSIQNLKAMEVLTADRVQAGLAGNETVEDARNIVNKFSGNIQISDEQMLAAINNAAKVAKDSEGNTYDYVKGGPGIGDHTVYSNQAREFASILADEFNFSKEAKENFIKEVSDISNDNSEIIRDAVVAATDLRRTISQELLNERSKYTEAEGYIIPATDKFAREAFGATAIEKSFFNDDYITSMDVQNINDASITPRDIKNLDAGATVELRGQTTGNVGGADRKNIIDVTYKNSAGKTMKATFISKIPDAVIKSSTSMYNKVLENTLAKEGVLTDDEDKNEAILHAAYQYERQAIPKTDNYFIIDNGEGIEDTEIKVRYKQLEDNTESYTPFIKQADGTWKTIDAKDTKGNTITLNSRNLKALTHQLSRITGEKAAASSFIKGYDQSQDNILDLVRKHESGKGKENAGYNSVVYRNYDAISNELKKPLTQATVNEIDQAAEKIGKKETAMGMYQITRATRDDFFKDPKYSKGFDKKSKFNKKLQDAMMTWLINSPNKGGYETYKRSKKTAKDKAALAQRLARVWASFPTQDGTSYYKGISNNKALFSYEELLKAIG